MMRDGWHDARRVAVLSWHHMANAALSDCEPVTIVTLQVLFKRLQGVKQRESVPLKPGPLLIAVYGDNW